MADDDTKKQHAIYGSAGMAAAGMIRTAKSRAKSVKEPSAETIAEEEVEAAGITDRSESLSDLVIGTEETAMEAPAAEPTPEEIALPVFQGYRAAVIGHTGRGNFGHSLDLIFRRLDGVRLVAIADGDAEALKESHARSGAEHAYADYREMLEQEKPDLVSVAPRWTDQHYDMVKAALEAGAHVSCERPLCRTLKEADELIALAAEKNLSTRCVAIPTSSGFTNNARNSSATSSK